MTLNQHVSMHSFQITSKIPEKGGHPFRGAQKEPYGVVT